MAKAAFIYTAQGLMNSIFGKTSVFGVLASVPTLYVGLSSTTPAQNGTNITEPSAGSYARVATSAADWVVATAADPSVVANANTITFPTATADWLAGALFVEAVLFDALTAGNPLFHGPVSVAKAVLSGDTADFPAGNIVFNMD